MVGYLPRYRVVVQGECGALVTALGDYVHGESASGGTTFVASLRDWAEFWGFMDRLRELVLHLSLHELDLPEGAS